jgi:hypothetical protein
MESIKLPHLLIHTKYNRSVTGAHKCSSKPAKRPIRQKQPLVILGGPVVIVLSTGLQGSRVQTWTRTMDFQGR